MKTSKTLKFVRTFSLAIIIGVLMVVSGCSNNTAIPATSVTMISAGNAVTITQTGGTLQMSATVSPTTATNTSVVWSLTNQTGEATISDDGLLTAIADGTVLVKATSQSVVTINDTMLITLSNQVAKNHSSIDAAIATATTNKDSVSISANGTELPTDITWVTQAVMTSYEDAIAVAQVVADNDLALQVTVDAAIANLATATTAFDTAKASGTNVVVTAISLISADNALEITTLGGTLQMSTIFTPENASDKSVVWSVTNETGEATISITGLLTAIADGTVTVTATSVSNVDVSDDMLITLSNQAAQDKTLLVSAIASANSNKETILVSIDGTDCGASTQWVTQAVMTSYEDAITAAQLVADSAVATQVDVDNAIDTLANATTTFNNAKADGTNILTSIALGAAGDFAVLAETGISSISTSDITGNIAVSPAAATYITGFDLILDASGQFSTSSQVTGEVYASDYAVPTSEYLVTAVGDLLTAYNTGVELTPDYVELYAGDLSGQTLTAGVYKYSNNVLINSTLTLDGSSTDVWVFQIAGTLTQATDVEIILTGGAKAENIFWVVADTVTIRVRAHFEGVIIAMTNIIMETNSSINGQLLARTAVTLDACTVVKP